MNFGVFMQISFSDQFGQGADAIATALFDDGWEQRLDPKLAEAAKKARFKARAGELFEGFVEGEGGIQRHALVGMGKPDSKQRALHVERAGAALAGRYLCSGVRKLAVDVSKAALGGEEAAGLALGLRLRGWRIDRYRTRLADEKKPTLDEVVITGALEGAQEAWASAEAVAEGVEFTRELVSEPANVLYPVSFVERCQQRFAGTGAELIVLDEAQLEELGMGALLGVGQGSSQPSRVLAIRWNGGKPGERPTAFVGKGVTFDTGGISIKPAAGMEQMKWDMGGAGAVAGAMLALVKRKARANIVGVVGLVENMPDGKAQRPGDIVTTMSGQTVEVLNTDAEGRLVLCDVLHWTQEEFDPERIVDFATLTGAMIISLGHEYGGLFANDDALAEHLMAAGERSGDKLWRMPLGKAYDKLIDSPIADIKNVGPREGGSITAAQFLQRFIRKGTPWAHCDIAGMVWSDKPGHSWDKGATGYGVRLIDRFVAETIEG